MTPMEITETWEAVNPICYDSDGSPVVSRGLYQCELGDLDSQGYVVWDTVEDIEFSSSLFPKISNACPCDEEVESEYTEDSSITGAAVAVACASTVTKKKTSRSSSESSSGSDDDE